MRTVLLLSLALGLATPIAAQTPPTTDATKPAPARRTPRRAAARSGVSIAVMDKSGMPLTGVHVQMTGPAENGGDTDMSGHINFPGLPAGTYTLRFSGESVTTFEREVTLRAGGVQHLDITLSQAEAPPPPPAPAAPAPPAVGPIGAPQLGSVSNLIDRQKKVKQPPEEILLACSANTRTELVFLTADQPERLYDSAEATYYVISGQGGANVGSLQSTIGAGTFVAVPRGTRYTIAHRGNRPLVLLWTLSGEPCETAR
jgi:mannose-6-phosphate isomerase-like protein (cupin superfamily)